MNESNHKVAMFTDAKQRSWTLEIAIPERREIKRVTGVDICDFLTIPEQSQFILGDVDFMIDAVWLLCKSQQQKSEADASKLDFVGEEDFFRAIGTPSVFPEVRKAWTQALSNFSVAMGYGVIAKVMKESDQIVREEHDAELESQIVEASKTAMRQQMRKAKEAIKLEMDRVMGLTPIGTESLTDGGLSADVPTNQS